MSKRRRKRGTPEAAGRGTFLLSDLQRMMWEHIRHIPMDESAVEQMQKYLDAKRREVLSELERQERRIHEAYKAGFISEASKIAEAFERQMTIKQKWAAVEAEASSEQKGGPVTELVAWSARLAMYSDKGHSIAESNWDLLVAIYKRCLGKTALQTLRFRHSRAIYYSQTGDLSLAKAELLAIVNALDESPEADEQLLSLALGVLGRMLTKTGDYESAGRHLRRALAIQEVLLAENGSWSGLSQTLAFLGMWEFEQGRYEQAKAYLVRSTEIAETYSAEKRADPEWTYPLAVINGLLGHTAECLDGGESCLGALRERHGPDHESMARYCVKVGSLYSDYGERAEDAERARVLFREALRVSQLHGRYSDAVADSCDALACWYEKANNSGKAKLWLKRAITCDRKRHGNKPSAMLAKWYSRLGTLCRADGCEEEATRYFRRAERIRNALAGGRRQSEDD